MGSVREIVAEGRRVGSEVVRGRELFVLFLDDWVNDLFVCVVSLDKIHSTTATPSQYNATWNLHGYSPLEVATPLFWLRTPFSSDIQDHPSGRLVPTSSSPCGSKDQERGQHAHHENPPPMLNSEPRILSTSNSKPSRDPINLPKTRMDDVLPPAKPQIQADPVVVSKTGLQTATMGDKLRFMRSRMMRWMDMEEVGREEGVHSIQEPRA